jgi:hypothetical protein
MDSLRLDCEKMIKEANHNLIKLEAKAQLQKDMLKVRLQSPVSQ